jgi:hypothetical protein
MPVGKPTNVNCSKERVFSFSGRNSTLFDGGVGYFLRFDAVDGIDPTDLRASRDIVRMELAEEGGSERVAVLPDKGRGEMGDRRGE